MELNCIFKRESLSFEKNLLYELMKLKHSSWYWLILVTFIHLAAIAYAIKAPLTPTKALEPSVQGFLISTPKPEALPLPPQPEPKKPKKRKPKPLEQPKYIPKAPPSEHAIKADEPVAAPVEVPEELVEEEPDDEPAPVIPPSADALGIQNPAPPYPGLSRRLREEGTVTLKLLVNADGKVGAIEVVNSSGYKRLDDAALNAISRWHFSPATQAGVAIDFWYEIDFEFSLRKK